MSNQVKLLIIDDNAVNLRLMKVITSQINFDQTFVAENGHEGLEIAKREFPQIILTDIQMPEMTGDELIQKVKAISQLSQTKIIAITAHAMAGDKEDILNKGFDAYLSKPVDTRLLRETLRQIVNEITNG